MSRKYLVACGVTAALAIVGANVAVASASVRGSVSPRTTAPKVASVYQGSATSLSVSVSANPTSIVTSPKLPVGKYLVNYTVALGLGAHDNVICAAGVTAGGPSNDSLFGLAGNGSNSTAVDGEATMTDTFAVTVANSTLTVWCNDTANEGSSATAGSITLLRAGALTVN